MTHDLAEYERRLIESAQAVIDAWNPDELEDETLVPIPVGLIVNLDDAVSEFTRAAKRCCPAKRTRTMNSKFDNPMTAKLVSIRTQSGDDLTPVPALRPGQTISQHHAIKRICSRADPPIWPAVEKRLIESTDESDNDNRPWRLLSLFAFAASAVVVIFLVMLIAEKLFH